MPRELSGSGVGRQAAGNINKVLRAGRSGVPRDLDRAGVRLVSQLKVDLSQPGRGNVYTTRFFTDGAGRVIPIGTRPPHVASAPGDTPAPDTGELRASYGHQASRTSEGAELEIGSGSDHAAYQEFGTSRMAPRPHLRPLMATHSGIITDEVSSGIEGRERAMARRLGGSG